MQYLLAEAEYAELKRKADAYDALNRPAAPAPDYTVPVHINAEGTGSDWKRFAQYDFKERIKACVSAEEVQAVLDANRESLDSLKGVSAAAYAGLSKLWTAQIDGLAGKAA